jgi:tetratricopeptide (TPR) repeat protein
MPDTEGARDDMRIARQYIDKSYEDKEERHGYFTSLDRALKYIERARQKDPNVTLKARALKGDGVFDWHLRQLEGHIYAIKGVYLSNSEKRDELSTAINLLQHSVKLFPLPDAYAALTRSYNAMGRRAEALALLKDGARECPGDMRIQSLIDSMEEDPTWGKTKIPAEPLDPRAIKLIIILIGFAVFFLSGYIAMWDGMTSGKQALFAFISLIGFVAVIVGFSI